MTSCFCVWHNTPYSRVLNIVLRGMSHASERTRASQLENFTFVSLNNKLRVMPLKHERAS